MSATWITNRTRIFQLISYIFTTVLTFQSRILSEGHQNNIEPNYSKSSASEGKAGQVLYYAYVKKINSIQNALVGRVATSKYKNNTKKSDKYKQSENHIQAWETPRYIVITVLARMHYHPWSAKIIELYATVGNSPITMCEWSIIWFPYKVNNISMSRSVFL